MNTETKNTILDLNAMMKETHDAIPEAAGFENPPDGEYTLTVKSAAIDTYTNKAQEEVQRLKITYEVAATLSTASGEQPVPDGTMFTETFQGTEQGVGFFKKRMKELMGVSDLVGITLKDVMDSVKGTNVDAKLSTKRTPKKDATGKVIENEFWENLQIRVVKK